VIDLELRDRIVVVTGGASNIGRGIVHAFARQGACVLLVDIDGEKAAATCAEARELGAARCEFLYADLSQPEHGREVIERAIAGFGHVDVLVNNFGWGDPGLLLGTSPDRWDRLWRMNLEATIACSQAALFDMKARRAGAIVSLASDAAQGVPNQSVYGALKAGVIAFTKAIAREFGRYQVRANAVSPGIVYPEAGASGTGSVWSQGRVVLSEKQIQDTQALSALGRETTADDIAHAVLFFASEVTGRQLTGQVLSVSGGWWMP
jgi:NAD(P)-dependent dehydrogenase (short-subunit alcohol dehydrogenase family)